MFTLRPIQSVVRRAPLCCLVLIGSFHIVDPADAAEASFSLAPLPERPYAAGAVRAPGSALFMPSGAVATDGAPADMKTQAQQAISILKERLAAAKLTLADVGFVRASLAPGNDGKIDYAGWEAAWAAAFGELPKPARSTVGVPFLGAPATLVQVEFVAAGGSAGNSGTAPGTAMFFTAGTLAPTLNEQLAVTERGYKGDMETQARGTLLRLQANLATVGLTFADVVSVRAFLAPDVHLGGKFDYDGWNRAYGQFFGSTGQPQKPERTTVTTPGFGDTATLIEIEMIAAFPVVPTLFDAASATPQLKIYGSPSSPIASGIAVRPDAPIYFSSGVPWRQARRSRSRPMRRWKPCARAWRYRDWGLKTSSSCARMSYRALMARSIAPAGQRPTRDSSEPPLSPTSPPARRSRSTHCHGRR